MVKFLQVFGYAYSRINTELLNNVFADHMPIYENDISSFLSGFGTYFGERSSPRRFYFECRKYGTVIGITQPSTSTKR